MSGNDTRTRFVRLTADGLAGTPGARVWGILCNVGTGQIQIKDGTAGGALLFDGILLLGQFLNLTAPIRCPAGAFIDLIGPTDVSIQVDY